MYAQVVNVLTIIKILSIIRVVNTSSIYEKSCSVFGHSKIKIIKELRTKKQVYEMLNNDPRRIVELISRKLS